ncbi:tRNA threonylcarbamoyladenosine biosynthesis protein TsaE [Candidatus Gullanella endobia]|uniref:tRNA threonylcarbamoyladenosine biosynthesis protein TsaE n=1 Tax=Candidatus Gullanella endobia TaxID=1070130 RepID=A0A143WRI3_9ENTR|nr:tRNA (adenosine(37)-N6)-threonylcarbamoyltransferase complex ATPase subunit type 1 TsaE [Candidatus Gullanella endobia]CUX96137.1 tRNA threonylcarbamoyladenosine biosynthesis protein TsaE [Candidatus Gullanella endobia]
MEKRIISLRNEMETVALGTSVAAICWKPCLIYLYGDLGTGKTTFCHGFLRALGYTGNLKSPTYALVESYTLLHWTVYHFDLYRLTDPEELEFLGIRDYFDNTALYLVEWPQRGEGIFPVADITLIFQYQSDGRQVTAQAMSIKGKNILDLLILS